jgi:hypothetical protein
MTSDNCTAFLHNDQTKPKITKFRITIPPGSATNLISITVRGTNLGCGENLYVTPLNAAEAEKWTGKWSSCPVVASSVQDGEDICTYRCRCTGDYEEIQVAKRPHTAQESSWTLCQISLTNHSAGNAQLIYIDRNHSPFTLIAMALSHSLHQPIHSHCNCPFTLITWAHSHSFHRPIHTNYTGPFTLITSAHSHSFHKPIHTHYIGPFI